MRRHATRLAAATVLALLGAPAAGAPALAAQSQGAYEEVPELGYAAVENPLSLPTGVELGPSSSVAVDANGHLYVFHRGPNPLAEFDSNGRHLRSFGDDHGFERPHGLRIDSAGNLWVTDVRSHVVMKLSPGGEVLLTIGAPGEVGTFSAAPGERLLSEPNDIAFGPDGEIFIAQGHGNGVPGVLKLDRNGAFLASWGSQGSGIGEFDIAHSILVDGEGQVHVADRENQRIQVFDLNGNFIRQRRYAGLPCGLAMHRGEIFMVSGYSGQVLRLGADGSVAAATGRSGDGWGAFGEAHYIAVNPEGQIFIADPVSGEVEKFVRR